MPYTHVSHGHGSLVESVSPAHTHEENSKEEVENSLSLSPSMDTLQVFLPIYLEEGVSRPRLLKSMGWKGSEAETSRGLM